MSQISEIPASAYTREMETLGPLPDILAFDGEPVPVSRNPLTPGTRPLQLLPLLGTEFPVRYETSRMRGFQFEVDLGKARSGGSATDASAFWDLLDSPMRARVVAAGFGDYAAGLHYAAITGLRFTGSAPPLDSRYQTAILGAQLVHSLLGVTTQTRYSGQGCMSYEMVFRFWAERIRTHLEAWRELLEDARPAAPAYTQEERDQAARSGLSTGPHSVWLISITVWMSGPMVAVWSYEYCIYPGVRAAILPSSLGGFPIIWPTAITLMPVARISKYRGFSANDFLSIGDFPSYFASRMQARLPEVLEYTQEQKTHRTAAHYRAKAAAGADAATALTGPAGVVLGDVPFSPGMEAPPPVQLDPEHTTHVPAQRYQEICQRFGLARSYIGRLYSDVHERAAEALVSSVQRSELSSGGGGPATDEDGDPNTMVFRFEDAEITPTYEELCAVMDHHPEQNEAPALPPGPRYDLAEIVALCPVYLPDGINTDQGVPLEPFLNKVLSLDLDPSWIQACCFLLLNVYVMKNRQPGIGDFRLLTSVRDMQFLDA
ncbi:hypothetical protein JCGZ_17161 [Jatropha curcas]|uniref:Aminotransferase-like plant mobile domain-containing protein n=1 Tax=Jatropha curcas TaxID=180498 RepID=A0A067K260_JATCU|nr:hypothetical protein JCGZ_17161 [Jatropha curcas]